MVGRIEEIKTLDEIMSRKEGQLVALDGYAPLEISARA